MLYGESYENITANCRLLITEIKDHEVYQMHTGKSADDRDWRYRPQLSTGPLKEREKLYSPQHE